MSEVELVMPRLSDSMEEGTVLRWLKREGERVARGEEVAEIETDKATMAYASDGDGFLHILADEGTTLPVGAPIARLTSEPSAQAGEGSPSDGQAEPAATPTGGAAEDGQPEPAVAPSGGPAEDGQPEPAPTPTGGSSGAGAAADRPSRVRASPLARRIARERGVELGTVTGSGPGGRVVRVDVETADPPAPASPAGAPDARPGAETARGVPTVVEPTRSQRAVARRMAESRATVPDFTVSVEVDMTEATRLRKGLRSLAGEDPVPSLNDMVVRACSLTLRAFPRVNASYRDGRFELYPRINVGIAVANEEHLTVPVIHDADHHSLGELARLTRALGGFVRDGTVTPPQLAGATFTVSNLGMLGADRFTAIITPPQAAILAVGAARPRPVLRDGAVVPGVLMELTMACDHRIVYGAEAARFLARLRDLLEQPLALA